MTKVDPTQRVLAEREVIDDHAFEQWLEQRGYAWQKLARGEYDVSLDELRLVYVFQDPVLWCRAFMDEPDTGEPYTFFDYQEPSVRSWGQNVVHQDGAEVGKTREITALILWGVCTGFGFTVRNPSILVAAPQQTHLDEIIRDILMHVGEGEGNDGAKPLINNFWRKPEKAPHWLMKFKSPTCTKNGLGLVYFRPAGHDGTAFRGVHVSDLAIMDEAAKNKEAVCWTEFFRAMKPGCRTRMYSVPDGNNKTEFYRMTQQAVPNLPEGKEGFRLFHWPKTLMPEPFWSEERKQQSIRLYGGEHSPGYQRNVLGEHGQQESSVWPWKLLERNIRDIEEYRVLKITVDDSDDTMKVEVERVELLINEGKKSSETHTLLERYDELGEYKDTSTRREAVRSLLREAFEPMAGAVLWGGADLGFSNDPTEIFMSKEVGREIRDIIRIAARGVEYWLQCELIYCLDELTNFDAQWGVDFGSAGTAVVQDMQNLEIFEKGHYEERMTGFSFQTSVDRIDEEGNTVEEEDGKGDKKVVRIPAKQLATELITRRFQNNTWSMPYDTEVINDMSNHTAREGQRNMIYSKDNDHTIDARRAQMLRKVFNEDIGGDAVFQSGCYKRAS